MYRCCFFLSKTKREKKWPW